MPRKKKVIEETQFVPSKYQSDIFEFVKHGNGNAVIEAVAGSGKSTTALKCLELMGSGDKILLTAFNKEIVKELDKKKKKLSNTNSIDCRTLHSLGELILMENYPGQIDQNPNKFKYKGYINNNIFSLSHGYFGKLNTKDRKKYIDNIIRYVNFGRDYMCENVSDMDYIESHYGIPTFYNEKEVALDVMEWGKANISTIDFKDMLWLPLVLNCKPYGHIYDWIVCDECQDINVAQRKVLLLCTKMSTRMLFFGEKVQSIYSFMGSDYRSFDELRKLPNTISLPLSISYRCSKSVVNFAKRFNPNIEAREDAPEGSVRTNVGIEEIDDGDMVLCRNNAPLLQLYCQLAKLNKPAMIRGKDVGREFINLIKETKETELNKNLYKVGVFSKLYNDLLNEIDIVMKRYNVTMDMAIEDDSVEKLYDQIQALEAISDGMTTSEELIEKIESLFSDKKNNGIELSTIHKAKGLESDNVFICCPSLIPSKSAKEDWELQQEFHLEYVAYTRAKINLSFLDEKDFTTYSMNSQQKAFEIERIKRIIFALHGNYERCKIENLSKDAALHIIQNPKPIEEYTSKSIDLGTTNKNKGFSMVLPRRKSRKKK